MKHHKLGNSDLIVPMCCLGTMTFGEQNSQEEAFEQMDYAMAKGVNFFDTAELYPVPPIAETQGLTEVFIGNWLTARNCRDKVILATKVAGPPISASMDRSWITDGRKDPKSAKKHQPQLNEEQIREAVDASLRRLQTSYIDLIQLHWPARYVPCWGERQYRLEKIRECPSFEEQVAAVGQLIKEGKVRYWGLSNETTYGVCQMCEVARRLGVPLPIAIQNDFGPVTRHFEGELAEACSPDNYNIGLLAYGALAGGTLTGKLAGGKAPEDARHVKFPKFQPRYHDVRTQEAANEYIALAEKKGISPTTLALAWCASRWYMGSVIIGATNMQQLEENIAAFDVQLDEETLQAVDQIHLRHRNPTSTD